jgi:prophage antirepressor-like protein
MATDNLAQFKFPETAQDIRSFTADGEHWFVNNDVCAALGIKKPRDAFAQLDADEKESMAVDTPGGRQKMAVVTEAGLYALMLISRSEKVKPFRRWITHEVIPALRRDGMVVNENVITDEQIEAGKARLTALAQRRLEERMDYQAILHSLKLGGAVADEYRMVQNTLYVRLFGATAARIRETRVQVNGDRLKRGEGFTKASAGVAKNYLSESELKTLNSTVLATFAQIQVHYPNGANAGQMIAAINRAADLMDVRAVTA